MTRFRRFLEASAAAWGLPRRALPWVLWTPVVGAVLVALVRVDKDAYRFLLTEDGPVEWAGFACMLVACISATGIATLRFAAGHRTQGVLFTCLAAATFFFTGEEISWGQRILGLETPAGWAEINEQHEITLHNVGEVQDILNVGMLQVSILGVLLCLFGHRLRLERYWDRANFLFVPPPFLAPAFIMLFLYKSFRFLIWTESGFTITKYGEWFELCLAFALALHLWLNYRLLLRERRTTPPDPPVVEHEEPTPTHVG